jgi:hypothetical protein
MLWTTWLHWSYDGILQQIGWYTDTNILEVFVASIIRVKQGQYARRLNT